MFCRQLEDVEVSVADQVQRVMKTDFASAWEEIGAENELEDTYALAALNKLDEAVKTVVQFLGMQPCDRTDRVPPGKSTHALLLAGE
jgi:coatomer protein complex subunit gamma